jgi:hypothetical protein
MTLFYPLHTYRVVLQKRMLEMKTLREKDSKAFCFYHISFHNGFGSQGLDKSWPLGVFGGHSQIESIGFSRGLLSGDRKGGSVRRGQEPGSPCMCSGADPYTEAAESLPPPKSWGHGSELPPSSATCALCHFGQATWPFQALVCSSEDSNKKSEPLLQHLAHRAQC